MKKYITILILALFMMACNTDDSLQVQEPCTCWEITGIGTFTDAGVLRHRVDFLQDCERPRFSLFSLNDPRVNEGIVGDCYNEIFM